MKIFKIDLDMIRQTKGYYIELAEDDYGSSVLEITLQKEGQIYDLTGVTAIEIPFKTPRGTIYVHDLDNGIEIADAAAGKITCTISTQALGDAGRVFFDVRIFKGLTLATSTPMTLYVRRPIINNSSITDMDQYPVLQTLIIQCQAITDEEAVRVAQETAREIAEGLRVQGEANRNTAYTTAETARDGSYGAKEEERDGKYALAETTRNGLYEGKETDRDNAYNLKEVERDGEYDLAETVRNGLYEGEETERNNAYGLAESGRDDSYADAESARDVLYGNAEGGRQSAYGDAELVRDGQYADAEQQRSETVIYLKSRLDAIDPFAVYGVSWDKSSNPTLTRTDSSMGLTANVGVDNSIVQNNFDKVQIFGEIYDVEDTLGNVFVRVPKFYIRKTDTQTLKTWQVSKIKHKGFYLPWCFWDFENGKELPYIDIGKYKASLGVDSKLVSKLSVPPLVSRNIVQFREYAKNNNVGGLKGYQQLDIHAYDILQTLMYVEFATLNMQSVMSGFTSGRYGIETELAVLSETATNRIVVSNATAAQYRVGQTISAGTTRYGTQVFYGRAITAIEEYDVDNKAIVFDGDPVDITVGNFLQNTGAISGFSSKIVASSGSIGSNSDGKYPCMYRGIESPYGDIWQFVDGVNINERQTWVALNANDYVSNVFASPYRELGYINSSNNGYPKEMGFDPLNPFAEFPISVGGSPSTYYSDYYYQAAGQRLAHVGGSWNNGSSAGPSYWYLANTSSNASVNIGGRLLKKPL